MATRHYAAVLYRGEGGFGVAFPDIPGCISYGRTIQEAAIQAEEALNGHIALMVRDNDPLPKPTPLDCLNDIVLEPEPGEEEAGRFLVKVEIPVRWLDVNISIDDITVMHIDHTARMLGMSRSGFFAEAARRMIQTTNGRIIDNY